MAKIEEKNLESLKSQRELGLWLNWSLPTKNEPNRTKIDDLVTKSMFGDRKS